ncbi:MAG TPA: glycosyltransferase [Bryobacteraceae bacterium]|nr:glycosyltransferase [Bryobacteraceae bacterium]
MFWYWLFAGPALLLAFLSLLGGRKRAAYVMRRLSEEPTNFPPASVIVPVKGWDEGLRENLAALASLDYPDYELLIAARSAEDIPPGVLPARARIVLAHGKDADTGEKVQNLAAAVRATRKVSGIFAFADSDGRVPSGWLRALAAPLSEPGVGASTGYRWYTPEPASLWSLLRGVWDAAAGGTLGPGRNRFLWGGATAILKETFFEIRVLEYWKNTVSDDYALSAALRAAGLSIAYAPGALVPCIEGTGARVFFAWARRQMMLTRVHAVNLWRQALVAHVIYCGGMVAGVVACAGGHAWAALVLAAQLAPGMWAGRRRAVLAKRALAGCRDWFRRHGWAHFWLVPAATWIWLVVLLLSARGDTIRWRGYTYKLKRPPGG